MDVARDARDRTSDNDGGFCGTFLERNFIDGDNGWTVGAC
ncbi:hypothetical protein HG15A2_28730 [Adhaeretor mobilis]|uniref:Uncharacterized protein n=1 Tax=Adhaeretor mobilis TaxID=1930276 RepID=A0A517MXG2_9BACT|nr:hypothetical protein HG15A2_28730 [Adhaeretor mobilis]